jgi:hypothetical protein
MAVTHEYFCSCGNTVSSARFKAGYTTCLECGEIQARQVRHCVVPMHKSNYIVVSDPKMLTYLNPKRGGI